jgi:hypothetical protein
LYQVSKNPNPYFAVYSDREKRGKFLLESVETDRAAAEQEIALIHRAGHRAILDGPRSDKNFPVQRKHNPRRRNADAQGARVSTYQLLTGSGRPIRKATKVTFADGREIRFMDRIPKREAIKQALYQLGRRRNPDDGQLEQAADLYREFHGRDPKEILEYQESELARRDYTALGDLVELHFTTPAGTLAKVEFAESGKDVVKVVSSPNGRQLYLIGGDQDLSPDLEKFGADPSKEIVDLGDAIFISYDAQKWQTDFKSTIWEHKLGEESGVFPRAFFDRRNPHEPKIFFAGGNYRVERPGIID